MLYKFTGWQTEPLQFFCTGLAIRNDSLISLQAPPLNGKDQVNHQAHSGGYVEYGKILYFFFLSHAKKQHENSAH